MYERIPQFLNSARFLVAAHDAAQWPPDTGREVAFAGRSNVGKSSALNVILNRRVLARTSKTPGRTQQIVFFDLNNDRRLVDLPGYGYARVPEALRRHWRTVIEHYISRRSALRGMILLMDVRHPLTDLDRQLLDWCAPSEISLHVLLTKSDKLSRGRASAVLHQVDKELIRRSSAASVQLFSADSRRGVEEVWDKLSGWLE